jgi:hypothetical protein
MLTIRFVRPNLILSIFILLSLLVTIFYIVRRTVPLTLTVKGQRIKEDADKERSRRRQELKVYDFN